MSEEHDAIGFAYPEADPDLPNAADRKTLKATKRKSEQVDEADKKVLRQIMGSNEGRAWIYKTLKTCHMFTAESIFSADALIMACAEGQRIIGLKLSNDVIRACPERYMEMLKEANGERS